LSPAGTVELVALSRPFGTWDTRTPVPALERQAIFSHPAGMTTLKS
jgi:hypothetical protein